MTANICWALNISYTKNFTWLISFNGHQNPTKLLLVPFLQVIKQIWLTDSLALFLKTYPIKSIRIQAAVTLTPAPFSTKLPATLIQFEYFKAFTADCGIKGIPPWLSESQALECSRSLGNLHTGLNSRSQTMHRNSDLPRAPLMPCPWTLCSTKRPGPCFCASYRDILDDLLHQDGIGQHVSPQGCMLKQQAKQLAHNRQLLRPSSIHP